MSTAREAREASPRRPPSNTKTFRPIVRLPAQGRHTPFVYVIIVDTYHHGDLRRALLAEALRFVESRGLEGLSLRELARRLRVSPAAPYHHFPDRAALLRELASQGFDGLSRGSSLRTNSIEWPWPPSMSSTVR